MANIRYEPLHRGDRAVEFLVRETVGGGASPGNAGASLDPGGDLYRIMADGETLGFASIAVCDAQAFIQQVSTGPTQPSEEILPGLAENAFSRGVSTVLFTQWCADNAVSTSVTTLQQREWALGQDVSITDFETAHADGVSALCRGEGWKSYANPQVAAIGCAAPGSTTAVAVNDTTGAVAGFAQVLSDGIAQGYLAQLIVHPAYRRIGLAGSLVTNSYTKSGARRLDLLTDDAEAFYETFKGQSKPGYRIYPER